VATTTVLSGNTAVFLANYSSASATYTWQVKNNLVWQNVVNSNVLNGANNDTLKLHFASIANSGKQYRCIVESGACTDTTNSTILSVLMPTDVNENIKTSNLLLYPNPANDQVSIAISEELLNSNYAIIDQLGRTVLVGKLNEPLSTINIEKLTSGYYIIVIDGKKDTSVKLIKL
jgi:hypothetical protein